ncbi:hypothetical protein JRI60_28085 [Archangium violaceum]|uniref:hypothetical protein n=1 Tax=Archangium violaceum TaxID=83451 RepID=UPI00194EBF1A|nr:hypothetical protein [Archangium violaceum]QRN93064.1 hypothetical protein JRI60_28085 [Archangium violaceum]
MPRSLLSVLAALSLLAMPAAARAEDDAKKTDKTGTCTIHAKKGDLVAQGKNLVVESGTKARDAIAIDGNVKVRAGATVNNVVSIRGKVTIEPGAQVSGDVTSLGGDVVLGKSATISGDVVALGGKIQTGEGVTISGEKTQLSVSFNGEELFQKLFSGIITGEGTRDCELSFDED